MQMQRPISRTVSREAMLRGVVLWACAWMVSMVAVNASAQVTISNESQNMVGVGIEQKLGQSLPLDTQFTDHNGNAVTLGDYFADGKPVLLSFVYYRCPGLCSATLSDMTTAIRGNAWTPGKEYRIVVVSFNPEEQWDLARAKRASYLNLLERPEVDEGWVFLTGTQENITRLTQAAGFGYQYLEDRQEFAHDAAGIFVSADGAICRYLLGTFFEPETFRLALVEASKGTIGSLADKMWIRLCGYDPRLGEYVVMARSVVMMGGVATVAALALVLAYFFTRESSKNRRASTGDVQPNAA